MISPSLFVVLRMLYDNTQEVWAMKSATAISYELDDISTTAKELTEQIRDKLAFRKNTVAILHGQPDM